MIGAVVLAGLLALPAAKANAVITPASPIPAPNITVDFG